MAMGALKSPACGGRGAEGSLGARVGLAPQSAGKMLSGPGRSPSDVITSHGAVHRDDTPGSVAQPVSFGFMSEVAGHVRDEHTARPPCPLVPSGLFRGVACV